MIKAIGIDPGLASTGIGIVVGNGQKVESYSFGTINTSSNITISERLNDIYSRLHEFFKQEKPDIMIIEDIFFLPKYPKSGIVLGKVAGIIMLAGERLDKKVKVYEIPVKEAKQILTGNGNASKEQLERAVRNFLNYPLEIKPNHASDALSLAIIGLLRYGR